MTTIVIIIAALLIFLYLLNSLKSKIRTNVIIFSPVKGKIMLHGEPLAEVKLIRTYPKKGKSNEYSETTYTDDQGNFQFDEVTDNLGIMRFLPHEAVSPQSIKAYHLDKEYLLWYTCKRNYEPLGEFKYQKYEPLLNSEMLAAYKQDYILLNGDLKNSDEVIQRVNDHIAFITIFDFRFPYELTLKFYMHELRNREKEFTAEISKWFESNLTFFNRINRKENGWSQMELDDLMPYAGGVITNVDSVTYSDDISLKYFEEDNEKDSKRVTISGEIILNIINTLGDSVKARIWLNSARFQVNKQCVILENRDDYFFINSTNINPNVKD